MKTVPAVIAVKKLIRNKATRAFLTEDGAWTDDIEKARQFMGAEGASVATKQFNIQNVELYYSFNDPRWDFTLPL